MRQEGPDDGDDPEEIREWIARVRRAIDPSASIEPPEAPTTENPAAGNSTTGAWIVDRTPSRLFKCGLPGFKPIAFDPVILRADMLVARHDFDAAIATLLREDWHGQVGGYARYTDLLSRLIHERHSPGELAQAWRNAEASLQVKAGASRIVLFGVSLEMPDAIREQPATAGAPAASPVERPLGR